MSTLRLRFLLAVYPSGWRRRHGDELVQLMSDLTADPGTSQVHLFFDVLRDASVQRLVSISLAHHLIVRRDRTGRVTAVVGAPATVVFNPKTKRVVSIRARARSGGLSGR
jgi:hypothetical protein